MSETIKIALISDIIASRKMKEREQIQNILTSILTDINKNFKGAIESNLTITLGDEFQGIVNSAEAAFLIIDLISLRFQTRTKEEIGEEVTLRWGIGIGRLSTPIKNRKVSIGTDGPAYWHAREAIESVHQYNDYGQLNEKLASDQPEIDFLNSIIRLQNVIKNDWTMSQKQTALIILNEAGYEAFTNQAVKKAMTDQLGQAVSEQTVSKRIISTHIKQYAHSRKLVAEKIEDWRRSHDH
ncbi:SatD family protein [Alkalibacterium indicireducens]|uniref:SatD family protein n=1 Tax=Alkalibacterium indicireducens TaxID=398758 RepID=A0ABN1ALW8_9LACT